MHPIDRARGGERGVIREYRDSGNINPKERFYRIVQLRNILPILKRFAWFPNLSCERNSEEPSVWIDVTHLRECIYRYPG